MRQISEAAVNLIILAEVSSQTYYEKKLRQPDWPGGISGVTIGIGYDLGYATKDEITSDWSGHLPADQIALLLTKACGLKGEAARLACAAVHDRVDVPWADAIEVFNTRDVPKWIARTQEALPNTDKLSDDSFGALVSLAYNRGADFTSLGDRRLEMRNIKAFMNGELFERIPTEFRRMKRLWPEMKGLRDRRDMEAALFEQGLKKPPTSTSEFKQFNT